MNSSRILQLPRRIPSTRASVFPRSSLRNLSTGAQQNTSAPSSPWTRRLIYGGIFGALGIGFGKLIEQRMSAPPVPGSPEDQIQLKHLQRAYEVGLPIVQQLRSDPDYVESDVYEYFSDEHKSHRLTSGPLAGSRGLGLQLFANRPRLTSNCRSAQLPNLGIPFMLTRFVDRQKVFWNDKDQKIVSVVAFGSGIEGWPTMVHGGALGTVIDENLGRVAIRRFPARTGVTANLNINYRAPVYSGNFYSLHTTLDQERSTDRKAYAKCELRDMTGRVCVEATGLFVVPKKLQLRTIGETF